MGQYLGDEKVVEGEVANTEKSNSASTSGMDHDGNPVETHGGSEYIIPLDKGHSFV